MSFPADVQLDADGYARGLDWQASWALHIEAEVTHLLLEAGRPVLGTLNGGDFRGDVSALTRIAKSVALVFHGSEIRDPRRHAELYPWSPFSDARDRLTRRLQWRAERLQRALTNYDGPRFVSTPDLLDDVPEAVWLPVVVDPAVWVPGPPPLSRAVPVVVHAPSNPALKGTRLVEPVLHELARAGRIVYRRIEGVPATRMPQLLRDADFVLDHFGIGNYGVLTCEAMAAGRVVVSHVHERVRERVGGEVPVVEATPATLREVLLHLIDGREEARAIAAAGPLFVRAHHDGRRSAQVLAPFLGWTAPREGAAVSPQRTTG
jgi:hypothetical protein